MIKEIKFRDYFHYLSPPPSPSPPSLMFTFKLTAQLLINFFLPLFLCYPETRVRRRARVTPQEVEDARVSC